MRLLHSPFADVGGHADWRCSKAQSRGHKVEKIARNADCRARNASALPTYSGSMPPDEAEPGFDLGNLGPAHRHAMRRRAVKLDDRAIAFLANQGDVRHRHDMAAVHPDKQTWIELSLGLRDRPRAHPLPRAVVDLGIVGVGADTPDIRGVDEVGAVGTLDRQPWRGCGAR